jgi:hypothetical protein
MDGKGRSFGCLDNPGCNPCDVCDPDGDMLKIVQAAVIPGPAGEPGRARGHPSAVSSAPSSDGAGRSGPPSHAVPPSLPPSKSHLYVTATDRLRALSSFPKVASKQARVEAGGEGGTLTPSRGGSSGGFSQLAPIAGKVGRGPGRFEKVRVSQSPHLYPLVSGC